MIRKAKYNKAVFYLTCEDRAEHIFVIDLEQFESVLQEKFSSLNSTSAPSAVDQPSQGNKTGAQNQIINHKITIKDMVAAL